MLFMISNDEILQMEKTYGQKSTVWQKAFKEYNMLNEPLSMNCKVCFFKVLRWHKSKLK